METVLQSLRHSCRSELTRQGISLTFVTSDLDRSISEGQGISACLCMSPYRSDYIIAHLREAWRIVSEDFRRSLVSHAECVPIGKGRFVAVSCIFLGAWNNLYQSRTQHTSTRECLTFPADCPHRMDCHCPFDGASTTGYTGVSSIWPSFTKASCWLTLGPS